MRGEHFHMQDNYVNADLGDLVYIWQLRKAGLQEYFATRELDNFYFDKLIRLFGKIPVTFPSQPAENWCVLSVRLQRAEIGKAGIPAPTVFSTSCRTCNL